MKKNITYIISLIIVLMITFTLTVKATTATVTADNLNFRKEASTDSESILKLKNGVEVEVLGEEGDWYKIKYNDYTGYIKKDYAKLNETTNQNEETNENNIDKKDDETKTTKTTIEGNLMTLGSNAKIRILPSINTNVLEVAKAGDKLQIISKTNHWYFVQTEEIAGWIYYDENAEIIEEAVEEEKEETVQEEVEEKQEEEKEETTSTFESVIMYVNANSIYLREGPSTETDAITSLIRNTDVKVIGEENGWYKVEYDGKIGYIRKDLLSETKVQETSRDGDNIDRNTNIETSDDDDYEETPVASGTGAEIVEYAYNFLGCSYVYGTAGPNTFDCSGFTYYVYKHFGYTLPRSSLAQSTYGKKVDDDDLQAGDIVCFLDYQTMDKVGHCGIYIGNGKFIHASSGSGYCVKVSDLTTGSYKTRYAGARRVL